MYAAQEAIQALDTQKLFNDTVGHGPQILPYFSLKYSKDKIFSNRKMEIYRTAGRLAIRRQYAAVFEENLLSVTLGSLRTLCTKSATRTTFEFFFTLQKRLRILNKGRIFPRENWNIQREIWRYLRTASRRVIIEQFLSVKRLDGFVLCIPGWRKTLSSKFLAARKRLTIVNKGRTFSYGFRREIWKNIGLPVVQLL